MKELNIDIAVSTGQLLNLKIQTTCIAEMAIMKLSNNTQNSITTTFVDRHYTRMDHAAGTMKSVGIVKDKAQVTVCDIDRFTRLEIAAVVRDGVAVAMCKLFVRGSIYLNAMYRGDGKHRIVIDKFKDAEPKEQSQWRKPNSRLQSALNANSK